VPASLLRSLQTSPVVSRFTRDWTRRLQCSALIFSEFKPAPRSRVCASWRLERALREAPSRSSDPIRGRPIACEHCGSRPPFPRPRVKAITDAAHLAIDEESRRDAPRRGAPGLEGSSWASGGVGAAVGAGGARGEGGDRRAKGEGRRAQARVFVFPGAPGAWSASEGHFGEGFLAGGWRAPLTRECSHIS
jgi:hypothetical protein